MKTIASWIIFVFETSHVFTVIIFNKLMFIKNSCYGVRSFCIFITNGCFEDYLSVINVFTDLFWLDPYQLNSFWLPIYFWLKLLNLVIFLLWKLANSRNHFKTKIMYRFFSDIEIAFFFFVAAILPRCQTKHRQRRDYWFANSLLQNTLSLNDMQINTYRIQTLFSVNRVRINKWMQRRR